MAPATTILPHRLWAILSIVFAGAVLMCTSVRAEVLDVAQDGSGDYVTLQEAVSAASVGDTIQVGPGRYDQFALFATPDFVEPTVAGIDVDSLTIVGSGPDATILGPALRGFGGAEPKGIAMQAGLTYLSVRNLAVENVHDGMWLVGRGDVSDSRVEGCELGIAATATDHLSISNSVFRGNLFRGIAAFTGTSNVSVSHCVSDGDQALITFNGTQDGLVEYCVIRGASIGVQFSFGATGIMRNCRVEDSAFSAVAISILASVEMVDNVLLRNVRGVSATNEAHLSGGGNLIEESTLIGLEFAGSSTAQFNGNDIVSDSGLAVLAHIYLEAPIILDLTENFWGTVEREEIAALIQDGNDDPMVRALVDFEPFAMQQVPIRRIGLGRLKALFGRE